MSDDPAPKPAAPPGPRTPKALLLIMVLNLGATGFMVFKAVTASPAAAATAPHAEAAPPTAEVAGPVVALDPFVVNLDEPGTARYLKISLQLELFPEAEHSFEKGKQLVRDSILRHLSGLHVKDTLGAEAKDKIRTDMLAELEHLLGPNKVRRIFFQEFVVQ
jgi:flagellar protein FliL